MSAFNQTGQQVGTQINAPAPTKRISELIAAAVAAEREAILEIVRRKKELNQENPISYAVCDEIDGCIRARGNE